MSETDPASPASTEAPRPGYWVQRMTDVDPVACPCGESRRAFDFPENPVATMHLVDVSRDARRHYHRRLTEIYYVLEGHGEMELDDDVITLEPGMAVMIRPGTRHRARGQLRILNVAVPRFDPEDEHFDEDEEE